MSLEARPNPSRPDLLDLAWRAASDGRVTLGLLAALALTLLAVLIFPQQPAGLDPAAGARWLSGMAAAYGSLGPTLSWLGVFSVAAGPWPRLLLALFSYNLLLRAAAFGVALRRAWRAPLGDAPLPPAELTPLEMTCAAPLAETLARGAAALRGRYRTVLAETAPGRGRLYAERGRAGLIGALLLCVAPLLLAVGLLVNDAAGWQATEITLIPDATFRLAQASGAQAVLTSVAGQGQDAVARVTLISAGAVRPLQVSPVRPANWGNLWLALRSAGPSLQASARDAAGRPLLLQALLPGGEISSTIHIPFRQTPSEQGFAAPARNLTFRAVSYPSLPERGLAGPVILVEAYRGDETAPFSSALVQDEATLTVGDVVCRLRSERYVVLDAYYLPGLLPMLLGVLLGLAGAALALGWPRVELWADLAELGGETAVVLRAATPSSRRLAKRLLADLQPAPSASPAQEAA